MYKLCKTEQSACRQRELEEGLLSAMKLRRYDEITISDLCEQMEIPRKSFYRYFSGKDGALHALMDHTLLEIQQTSFYEGNGGWNNSQQALERYFEIWLERRQFLEALTKSGLSGMLVQRAIHQAQEEQSVPAGAVPEHLRAIQSQAVSFAICGLMSMVLSWQRDGFVRSPREMADIAAQIMSNPMIRLPEGKK